MEVRRPEKETAPKLFYLGAGEHTLDPQSPSNPQHTSADSQVWGQSQFSTLYGPAAMGTADKKRSGNPDRSAAAAILVYDQPHRTPWDWRVSSYSWTKSVASGVFLMTAILGLLGISLSQSWEVITAVLSAAFLGATGLLLVADLSHPIRFYYVLTRPQWKSWLVRGAYILCAFVLVLLLFFIAALLEWRGPDPGAEMDRRCHRCCRSHIHCLPVRPSPRVETCGKTPFSFWSFSPTPWSPAPHHF